MSNNIMILSIILFGVGIYEFKRAKRSEIGNSQGKVPQ